MYCCAGSDLALYDIAPVTPGVAADLSHIPTPVSIKGYAGEDPTPALEGADVVLISAGVARKPGMDRADPQLTLKTLEEKTPLVRCHRQYLVSIKAISEIKFLETL